MSAAVDTDLAGAQAKFVVFLAALLERAHVVDGHEFASLLSTFAVTVVETNPGEGEILDGWASAVRLSFPDKVSSASGKKRQRGWAWLRPGKR